jgi:hypothetical protein
MKKIVSVTEVEGEGLIGLLGENVILFCMNYIEEIHPAEQMGLLNECEGLCGI